MIVKLKKEIKELKKEINYLNEVLDYLDSMINTTNRTINNKIHRYPERIPLGIEIQHIHKVKELISSKNALEIHRVSLNAELDILIYKLKHTEDALNNRKKLIKLRNPVEDNE